MIRSMVFILCCWVGLVQAQTLAPPQVPSIQRVKIDLKDFIVGVKKELANAIDEKSYEKRSWITDDTKKPLKFSDLSALEQKVFVLWQYEDSGYKLFYHETMASIIFSDKKEQEAAAKMVHDLRKEHALKFEDRIQAILATIENTELPVIEKDSYVNRIRMYHNKYNLVERKTK